MIMKYITLTTKNGGVRPLFLGRVLKNAAQDSLKPRFIRGALAQG